MGYGTEWKPWTGQGEYQTQASNSFFWERCLHAYHLVFMTTNYSDTVVLYYYVHGIIHQGQNYGISYISLILNLKIITIIIITIITQHSPKNVKT